MSKKMIKRSSKEEGPENAAGDGPWRFKVCSLSVMGLDCASCAEKVEKSLMRHKGIQSVTVYLGAEKVDVRFEPSVIGRDSIEKIISGTGHKVVAARSGEEASRSFELWRMGTVLFLIILSIADFGSTAFSHLFGPKFTWDLPAILIGGYPLFRRAVADLKGKAVTADVFMALGVAAATAIGEFRSAAIIAFFMLIAESLDSLTMEKSRRAIKDLIDLAPKTARIRRGEAEVEIPVEEVKRGISQL